MVLQIKKCATGDSCTCVFVKLNSSMRWCCASSGDAGDGDLEGVRQGTVAILGERGSLQSCLRSTSSMNTGSE